MAERTVSIRLSLEDAEKVRAQLETFGDQGNKALNKIDEAALKNSASFKAFETASDQAHESLVEFAGEAGSFGQILQAMGPLGLAAAAGIGALTAALDKGLEVAAEDQATVLKLNAVLAATGNTTGQTRAQLDDFAESLASALKIQPDEVTKAEATLARFGAVSGEAFETVIKAAADLSAIEGGDLASNTEKIGGMMERLASGQVTSLGRQFRELGPDVVAAIESLEKAGHGAEAAQVFLEGLSRTMSGTAVQAASGLQGASRGLGVAWDEMLKAFANSTGATDNLTEFDNKLAAVITTLTRHIDPSLEDRIKSLKDQIDAANADDGFEAFIGKVRAFYNQANQVNPAEDPFGAQAAGIGADIAKNGLTGTLEAQLHDLESLKSGIDTVDEATKNMGLTLGSVRTTIAQLTKNTDEFSKEADKIKPPATMEQFRKTSDDLTAALKRGQVAITEMTAAQARQQGELALTVSEALKVAAAYDRGALAGRQADIARAAALDLFKGKAGSAYQAITEETERYLATASEGAAKARQGYEEQGHALDNLTAASALGTSAEHDADVQNQITAATRETLIAREVALTAATNAQTDAEKQQYLVIAQRLELDAQDIANRIRLNDIDKQTIDYNNTISALQKENDLLQFQFTITGQTKEEQDALLAGYQAEATAREKNNKLTQDQLDTIGQMASANAKLRDQLAEQKSFYQGISSSIESSFESSFQSIFENGTKGFADFGKNIENLMAQVAAKIAVELIFHPDVVLGPGGILSNATGIFSGGGTGGTGGSGLGSLFGGSSGGGTPGFEGATTPGVDSSGNISGLAGSGGALSGLGSYFGAAGVGAGAASLATGVTGSQVAGNLIGGAIAGAMVGGPIGAVVGLVIGGLISLFESIGGPPQHHDGLVTLAANKTGVGGLTRVGIGVETSDHQDITTATNGVTNAIHNINEVANRFGLDIALKGQPGISQGGDRNTQYAANEKDLIKQFLASHAFTSDDPVIQHVLDKSQAKTLNQLTSEIRAAEKAANQLQLQMNASGHTISSFQTQMESLRAEFQHDIDHAAALGQTQKTLRDAFSRQLNTSMEDQLRSIRNPLVEALQEEARDAEQRLATVKKLGGDMKLAEQINAQSRLQVYEQYYGETIKQLDQKLAENGHDISDVQSTMTNLIHQFATDMKLAAAAAATTGTGPSPASVQAAYASQFNNQVGDQLLQITDPEKFALEQARRDAAARLEVARKLGADIAAVEKLNAAERKQIIQQYQKDTTNALKDSANQLIQNTAQSISDYAKTLAFSGDSALTPQQQFALASAQERRDAALAAKGNVTAAGKLANDDQNLLTIARTLYGSTAAYDAIYKRVVADLSGAGAGLGTDQATKNAMYLAKISAKGSADIVNELKVMQRQLEKLNNIAANGNGMPHRLARAAV